jgi:glycosyltransferase involved in cell wall biosynthesis
MTAALSPTINLRRQKARLDGLVVADANWYTTSSLFSEAHQPGLSTLLLTCHDYYNAFRAGRIPSSWHTPLTRKSSALWSRDLVLPSGWMKRFPRLGMRPIRAAVEQWRREAAIDGQTTLVITYPHYLYLRDLLRPERTIYLNIDDYTQYWPDRAESIARLEQRAVRESSFTVCVSNRRAEQLRMAMPEVAHRIHHIPHGTPRGFLSDSPHHRPAPAPADLARLPRPYLGFVGSLEDRIDWRLLNEVAETYPKASIVLIGRPHAKGRGTWRAEAQKVLRRPNVHALGWRRQDAIASYIAAFDVCLIPYASDHPFNLSSCPTKIMDYMGSGRPIVSTDLPECRLYPNLLQIESSRVGFMEVIRVILSNNSDDGRAGARHAWAADHSCATTADRLLTLIEQASPVA